MTGPMEMDRECMRVRKGDRDHMLSLASPFLVRRRGFLSRFVRRASGEVGSLHLLAASEALYGLGEYRKAMEPLEHLTRKAGRDHNLKDLAVSRAGQIALKKAIPLDLGPIISELGLSRGDLQSAVARFRTSRGKKRPLVEMDISLLQAMLLHDRAGYMESEKLVTLHLRGALEGFEKSVALAGQIDGEQGEYHQARCLLELSDFLLSSGEFERGFRELDRCMEIARRLNFPVLIMESCMIGGTFVEDGDEAGSLLKEAEKIARSLDNIRGIAGAGALLGSRECLEGKEEGIDRLVHSAGLLAEAGDRMEAAKTKLLAALWCARSGYPERTIELAEEAYGTLKNSHEREMPPRALSVLLYGLVLADRRKKVKKLLMDIITNYPVKQFPETFSILKEAVDHAPWLREERGTRELFADEIIYTISRDAVEEIKIRAREAYPNEFGAMLRGIRHITHIEPIMEGASNRSSFMFSIFSRFTQRSVPGEGVVHSHPSGSARPSRADLSLFGRFPGINIIIAYPFEDDSMAAYDRMGNRVKLEIKN